MSTSPIGSDRVVGERKALLYPNRPANAHANVDVENRYPCTTILIHGVNDLGTDFGAVESGLCEGLNDRLGRTDLKGGEYTHGRMANDPSKVSVADLMKNLDDVIYRRQEPPGTKSPVIPFYWGFKASASDLAIDASRQTRNGQYIDKFGNRLDKHRAKGGGMFANATGNIPDMFDTNFKGGLKTEGLNWLKDDPTHPLYEAPNRHYQILAARRLATLVRQIRLIHADETVNIVAHSQGTLIALLAQAFLTQGSGTADRPADTLILIDSPYTLGEELMEQVTQRGEHQQTAWARAKTLANLTELVEQGKHDEPRPQRLKVVEGGADNYGITGPTWDPQQATHLTGAHGNASSLFTERDNRGKVYLYFCPEDATLALKGINAIGCTGLPDTAKVCSAQEGAKPETIKFLSVALLQRVFTRRKRQNKMVQVGSKPGAFYLREHKESSHGTSGIKATWTESDVDKSTMRTINGEELGQPFDPDLESNVLPGSANVPLNGDSPQERKAGVQSIDQLEAETALSASSLLQMPMQAMPWPGFKAETAVPTTDQVASVLNQGKEQPDDRCKVLVVHTTIPAKDGQILVIRQESPNEAKVRLMNDYRATSTYHSAVMSGQRNHRLSTAFDVSIGQARALDDPRWAKLLRAIADWRISLDKVQMASPYHSRLDQTTRDVVEASCRYYQSGDFPSENLVQKTPPPPVVSERVKVLNDQLIRSLKSNSINNASLF
ncbi:T6SS effector phospholipase Tle3 domain-containing protein [Paraburkholderia bryophila]|uniref:Alpha/beta hydrolase family protein DUF900 n=1 Tax=Paraburkholderia bryophila TaxID=420952 RepID=A0A7Y9W8Q9_9BURK|nr:DUF3274 domain-containing protein [Paraburkholderia bryophila]NYH16287.1 hypothetical protein [Paraburkholderia bryophila]